jgi:hypothetical protein
MKLLSSSMRGLGSLSGFFLAIPNYSPQRIKIMTPVK